MAEIDMIQIDPPIFEKVDLGESEMVFITFTCGTIIEAIHPVGTPGHDVYMTAEAEYNQVGYEDVLRLSAEMAHAARIARAVKYFDWSAFWNDPEDQVKRFLDLEKVARA